MIASLERNTHLKTVGGLAAALAFLATESSAGIVYNDVVDKTMSGAFTTAQVTASFDPISGATYACYGSAMYAIGLTNCAGSTIFSFGSNRDSLTSMGFLSAPVDAGTLIDASSTWTDLALTGQSTVAATFPEHDFGAHALIAYRFKTASDTYFYGWAEFSTDYVNPNQYVGIYSYAYDDSGAGIIAGATSIPEPGVSAALFGLVAFAVIGGRRLLQRNRPARA